jgi:hypothetical protein
LRAAFSTSCRSLALRVDQPLVLLTDFEWCRDAIERSAAGMGSLSAAAITDSFRSLQPSGTSVSASSAAHATRLQRRFEIGWSLQSTLTAPNCTLIRPDE